MSASIVCLDSGDGRRRTTYELTSGQSVVFGWREQGGALTLGGDVDSVAGRIHALDDYWLMTNQSRSRTYCVENLEGAGEFVKVQARRSGVPIPFELSRIVLTVPCRHGEFTVFGPEPTNQGDRGAARDSLLNENSRYYMVLVCLCEPRLRDCGTAAVPTPGQVCQRLSGFADDRALTRSAVNYHIDYLTKKLDVRTPAGQAWTWKRETLVRLALKFDLVRPEHLGLLPSAG
jgi:hypothetical protein